MRDTRQQTKNHNDVRKVSGRLFAAACERRKRRRCAQRGRQGEIGSSSLGELRNQAVVLKCKSRRSVRKLL